MDDGLSVQEPLVCNTCDFIFTTSIQEYSSLPGYHSVTTGNKEQPNFQQHLCEKPKPCRNMPG